MYLASMASEPGVFAFLERTWLIVQVVIGIGLMIFIHELGHFIAAKKTGVRVDTFSLGFGPKLIWFRKGETIYQISLVPLGGYVKMAGEDPGEELSGLENELPSKPPGQRMFIFSAGVLMNFLFAFITFPIIFACGVPCVAPEVGRVEEGGPAWKAGILPGDTILEINGNTVYEFTDIPLNIALAKSGGCEILLEREGEKKTIHVVPEKNEEAGRYQIRVFSPTRYEVKVEPGGPADRAGLQDGDRITAMDGLPPEEWLSRRTRAAPEKVAIEVARMNEGTEETVAADLVPEKQDGGDRLLIGVQGPVNEVIGLRNALALQADKLREGDIIVKAADRYIFKRSDLEGALQDGPLSFVVKRSKGENGKGKELLNVEYTEEWRDALQNDLAMGQDTSTNQIAVTPGGVLEEMGFEDGLTVHRINGKPTPTFDDITDVVSDADDSRFTLTVTPMGDSGRKEIKVTAKANATPNLGVEFQPYLLTRKLNLVDAIKAGFNCSIYMIKTCYLTLSRIISGDVAGKNLGGIVSISVVSYSFAELGLARLFFFLAILSINLGFINILPIPVLDGGHLLFLLIEKIKGSPVNEKVMSYSQIVGVVLILALLVYVTYNDILRLFN